MTSDDELWQIERGLWLGGPGAYRERLAEQAVMLFAGIGILRGEQIVAAVEGAPRWDEVTFEMTERARGERVTVLAYRAVGRRGEQAYRALCSSTYTLEGGAWRLLAHQQTPA